MKRWLLALGMCCLGSPVWAVSPWAIVTPNGTSATWYVGGGVGATFPSVNRNAFVNSGVGLPPDLYRARQVANEPFVSLDGGYMLATLNNWFPYVGLGLSYTCARSSTVKGTIAQFSLAEFQNYNYQYDIQRQTFLGTIKADIYSWGKVLPYFIIGGGVSRNRATGYSEQAVAGVTPRTSPNYAASANNYFSYMGGLGLDYILSDHLWASLEYNYGNYGYAQTGRGSATYSSEMLKNKLTANNLLLSVNYYF